MKNRRTTSGSRPAPAASPRPSSASFSRGPTLSASASLTSRTAQRPAGRDRPVQRGGFEGSACAYDLLQHPRVERVTVADLKPDCIPALLNPYVGKRLALLTLDVQDAAAVRAAVRGHDA